MSNPWAIFEDRILKREFHNGKDDRQIAKYLAPRTSDACKYRRQRLGMWRENEQPLLTPRDEWQERIAELLKERAERERIPPTLDNILTGTPPRGRSAYDGFKPRGGPVAEAKERPQPWHPLMSPKRFGDHSAAQRDADSRETN